MSIERDDLVIQGRTDGPPFETVYRDATDEDLAKLGYVKEGSQGAIPYDEFVGLAKEWAAENPDKALDAALRETHETCGGMGWLPDEERGIVDCDCYRGKALREGVRELVDLPYVGDRWIAIPAEWLDTDDES